MLIDKGINAGDIITIKTAAGEEIISKYIEETDTYIKVNRPMVLAASAKGIGMAQYLFTVDPDKDIKINKPVVIMEPTENEAAKQYLQYTTNIKLAL